MLKKLILSHIFKSILSNIKGGSKWLVILALLSVLIVQALGIDLGENFDVFARDVINQIPSLQAP